MCISSFSKDWGDTQFAYPLLYCFFPLITLCYFCHTSFAQRKCVIRGNPFVADLTKGFIDSYHNSFVHGEKVYFCAFGETVLLPQIYRNHDPSKLVDLFHNPSKKIKKCAHRSRRTKTQTPIVAKLIYCKTGIPSRTKAGICILSNSNFYTTKKGILTLNRKGYLLCNIWLVWHSYYTTVFGICKGGFFIVFKKHQKVLFYLADTHRHVIYTKASPVGEAVAKRLMRCY